MMVFVMKSTWIFVLWATVALQFTVANILHSNTIVDESSLHLNQHDEILSSSSKQQFQYENENIVNVEFNKVNASMDSFVFQKSRLLQTTAVALPYFLNCGKIKGDDTDPITGIVWKPDMYFTAGSKSVNSCTAATTAGFNLFSKDCLLRNGATIEYNIPVSSQGQYEVTLHLMEPFYTTINKRLFTVTLEGSTIINNLDLFATYGRFRPGKQTFITTVTDGAVTIQAVSSKEKACISGIEIKLIQEYRINCGSNVEYVDSLGLIWKPDTYFLDGLSSSKIVPIDKTIDDTLYQYERVGETFSYAIPVAEGSYEIRLFFAETEFTATTQRVFNILIEKTLRRNTDIMKIARKPNTAAKLTFFELVADGFINIQFSKSLSFPFASIPKLNAIEIILDKPHISHAVATGPYTGTIVDTSNKAKVSLIGQTSHTHGLGATLNSFIWKEGSTVLGTNVNIDYDFTEGNHTVSLTIKDTNNFEDTETTTVTIKPLGFPAIIQLVPNSGKLAGNDEIIIRGSGFTYTATDTKVVFGSSTFTGAQITIINSTAIRVLSPVSLLAQPVSVVVTTPVGTSDTSEFNYIGVAIQWQSGKIVDFLSPTVGRFGPDQKLYVGTRRGRILKITMNSDFTQALNVIAAFVNTNDEEAILGMAFDPMDTKSDPDVYFTSNDFFHKGNLSSSGSTVNGKIRRASGPNLETVIDVITGLPVSDLDHGLNGIVFGDEGELYFTSGSHTNGGIPGPLSSSNKLKENFLSAGVNVAYLSHPNFNGNILWSAPDDGNMIANGIDVFGMGLRNPFGIVLHSNGKLYSTDNGPNEKYGGMSTGCGPNSFIDGQKRIDRIVHVQKGHYYGHPNKKRATYFNSPIQCVWIPPEANITAGYTPPIMTYLSSIDGIMEYHSNHFNGELRSHLIFIRYNGLENILRAILTPDGNAIVSTLNNKPIKMNIGNLGLDITQAPNGNLIEMRYAENTVFYYRPVELFTSEMIVKTVFPHRGPNSGGNKLYIYGVNFDRNGPSPTVQVGGINCPVTSVSTTRIDCILPGGTSTVDIVVTNGASTSTFQRGYRYVSGVSPPGFVLPVYSG